jgi:hypothetical protein
MFSVICVYNNHDILKECLIKSLEGQTAEFELIKIDNTESTFTSAAQALNFGGKKAKGEYILFVHQDVDLSFNTWLEDAEKILNSISDLGIAGVAGLSEEGKTQEDRARNLIRHGDDEIWGKEIKKPEPVQTLDECLAVVPRSVFNDLKFDEKVCEDWHLYTVDYCLSVQNLGLYAYAIPMFIYHKSTGDSSSNGYQRTLKNVLKKHKGHTKRIYTTFGVWRTSSPLILQKIVSDLIRSTYIVLAKIGFRYLWRKSGLKKLYSTTKVR